MTLFLLKYDTFMILKIYVPTWPFTMESRGEKTNAEMQMFSFHPGFISADELTEKLNHMTCSSCSVIVSFSICLYGGQHANRVHGV